MTADQPRTILSKAAERDEPPGHVRITSEREHVGALWLTEHEIEIDGLPEKQFGEIRALEPHVLFIGKAFEGSDLIIAIVLKCPGWVVMLDVRQDDTRRVEIVGPRS